MKLKLNIVCCLLVFSLTVNSQTYFNKVYDYNNTLSSNHATTCIELNNGDFLIGGVKFPPVFGAVHFIRINIDGDTLLTRNYPKQNCIYSTAVGVSLIKCLDGNYAQTGAYIDSSATEPDALLIKLTENGDTLWTKTYGGTNFDDANVVCQTLDSGFVMMGVTQSFSTGAASDFYMIKTDKNGNQLWQKVFGTTAVEDCISGQITLDGGFIMSGRKSGMFYIIKTDSSGNFQWQKTYSGTVGICFVKQLADSSYLLTGAQTISGLGYQACMIKTTKTGNLIWQKNYGGSVDDWFYTMPVILSDGSIVIGGQTMLGSVPIGLLIKTDSAGNQQWSRTYFSNPNNDNYVYDLKATSDNGFVIVGSGGITSQDAWVVKTDEYGCEVANCNVGISDHELSMEELIIYPNPAYHEVNIQLNNADVKDFEIYVTDVLGKQQKLQLDKTTIDISALAPGIYFISATGKDKPVRFTKKFVKE
jgi:hypothetical protein